ncbi:MAG: NAD-dependent dehydratase [Chlamydiae bacterium CG10_big_fil_rev_8_21_14_0_10_35_9]|nr:MAG: NAD-dependent dehydratase [Chlamydiae bacterium CG10_big_fil_rev_8_21_14_0_10_35_9]
MRKKRILVTGGAGFLGSHICEKLVNEGHYVYCLDNFFTGKKENIAHLLSNDCFSLLDRDICLPIDLEVQEIYNLACPASPYHYQLDPIQTLKTSVWGAMHMLELAKKNNAKVLQASTSEVYGDPQVHPQEESYWGNVNPIGRRSCYDEGKRCAETLFFDFRRAYRIPIKVVRIFNTFGPRMQPNDGRVVSNFIVQALKNQPLTIYGDGKQTRSFCYVDDLIEGIFKMMDTDSSITGPINLGNPLEYRIIDLAEIILKLTGSKSPIISLPLPSDDPKKRKPNIELAKKNLKWQPTKKLEEGLKETIEYFAQILEEDASLSSGT